MLIANQGLNPATRGRGAKMDFPFLTDNSGVEALTALFTKQHTRRTIHETTLLLYCAHNRSSRVCRYTTTTRAVDSELSHVSINIAKKSGSRVYHQLIRVMVGQIASRKAICGRPRPIRQLPFYLSLHVVRSLVLIVARRIDTGIMGSVKCTSAFS